MWPANKNKELEEYKDKLAADFNNKLQDTIEKVTKGIKEGIEQRIREIVKEELNKE